MEEHAASVFGWRYNNAWCHNPETDNPKAAALLSIYLIYKLVYSTDPLLRIICEWSSMFLKKCNSNLIRDITFFLNSRLRINSVKYSVGITMLKLE